VNVLVNTLGKTPTSCSPSSRQAAIELPAGDVKYHLAFPATYRRRAAVTSAFNPSHLEIVNPVVEGSVRARQERRGDHRGEKVLPCWCTAMLVRGQGVVMETLSLAQTRGYGTGGTVHIVINNQIGFTTSIRAIRARRCTARTWSR